MNKSHDAEQERGLVCCFCGEGFGYAGEKPDEATLKAACDHEAQCPKNPYLAKIARLVEAGKRLADQAKYCYTPDPAAKLFKEGAEYRSLKRRTDSLKGFVSAFELALKAAGEEG